MFSLNFDYAQRQKSLPGQFLLQHLFVVDDRTWWCCIYYTGSFDCMSEKTGRVTCCPVV